MTCRCGAASEEDLAAETNYAPELMRQNLVIGTPDEVVPVRGAVKDWATISIAFGLIAACHLRARNARWRGFIRDVMPAFR
jgi:flavin-dependent trigonelline monooxygenase, oxygenase component